MKYRAIILIILTLFFSAQAAIKTVILGTGYLNQYQQTCASQNGIGMTIAIAPPAISNNGASQLLIHKPDGTVIHTPVPFPNQLDIPDISYTPGFLRSIEWINNSVLILIIDTFARTGTIYEFDISTDLTLLTYKSKFLMPRLDPYWNQPVLCKTRAGGLFAVGFSVSDVEPDVNGIWHLEWLVSYRSPDGNWESRILAPQLGISTGWLIQNSITLAQHPDGPVLCWMIHDGSGVINMLKLIESAGTFQAEIPSISWTYAANAPPCDGELPSLVAVPWTNTIKLCYQAYPPIRFSDGGTNPDGTSRLYIKGNRIVIVDVRSDGTIVATNYTDEYFNFWETYGVLLNGDGELSIVGKHVDANIGSDDGYTPNIKELRITTFQNNTWQTQILGNAPLGSFITSDRLKPFSYYELETGENIALLPQVVIDAPTNIITIPPIPPTPTNPPPILSLILQPLNIVFKKNPGNVVQVTVKTSTQTINWNYKLTIYRPSGSKLSELNGISSTSTLSITTNLGKKLASGQYKFVMTASKEGWESNTIEGFKNYP